MSQQAIKERSCGRADEAVERVSWSGEAVSFLEASDGASGEVEEYSGDETLGIEAGVCKIFLESSDVFSPCAYVKRTRESLAGDCGRRSVCGSGGRKVGYIRRDDGGGLDLVV